MTECMVINIYVCATSEEVLILRYFQKYKIGKFKIMNILLINAKGLNVLCDIKE